MFERPISKSGWTRVAFGDVVRLSKTRVADPEAAGIERVVGLEHIEPGDLRIRRWGDVADGTTFTTLFKPGQVLFGKRRAYQRKVAVADFEGVCSGDIYVLEPANDRLMPELLPFLCQTDAFFDHAVGTSAGSLSPRTNWTSLASFEFLLPPIQEQARLVEALAAHRALVESLEEASGSALSLKKSILREFFQPSSLELGTMPSHWRIAPAEAVGDIQLGQQRHPKFETGSNVRPYLRVANVFDDFINFDDLNEMHFPEGELKKFELASGDILLNEGQSLELVGRSSIYRGEVVGCCFQKTLLRFRCGDDLIPEFAQCFFQHMLYSGKFAKIAVQTTSVAHLTAVRFKKVPIPVPPLEEQRRLVSAQSDVADALYQISKRLVAARSILKNGVHFHDI